MPQALFAHMNNKVKKKKKVKSFLKAHVKFHAQLDVVAHNANLSSQEIEIEGS
jgi:hypothetical protein